ncbi:MULTISPECIES: ATP-dependent zinc metalloprotease FtsH [Methylococcus]|jgi:cell division protease FtsH|uniref:ATP-dependent zinc metalloprotease FtsH n=2 Tax=Methylococcus capsulatus TaxID=414 RepID=FTSH_METCA|nr:ATP-dependent zinc metalloprotease FtsH [Methylococcus capsulatus]Q60AK1.1 RecName: Full=ATP-dependent zinc metalloprotease FtsH [Methylococcus capsulatus str. Bath]AAU93048.1 cell division protein FtsH [Methylococcus capsulatus str. Bath]QXP88376.1 ATP-dependent zinc metalloprotease FtsH [Methylococcus capsulatus]QXP94607.1 ATP-dependent zinc metalloprotease FtsH [Methylococcus capsulatus]UQN13418.1 ATP-dependent zinc metalloprotease FtsH [Methylococcus capsulatus]CAI8741182.1 ATP-depende
MAKHSQHSSPPRKLFDTLNDLWQRAKSEAGLSAEGPEGTRRRNNLILYLLLVLSTLYLLNGYQTLRNEEIPYSEFLKAVAEGRVEQAVVTEQTISGTLKPEAEGESTRPFITVPLWNHELAAELEKKGVKYTVRYGSNWFSSLIFNWIVPIVLLTLFWTWMARRMTGGRGFLSIGKKTRIQADTAAKVTFGDVAGADEAKQELRETIEFLQNPTRIQSLGGRMPKGVLLVGPPGTGKTLLARAVAGEAGVPFFNISGSEFIELFVGVGAARVRDLFEQARQNAPCIIFIDELDAIGRSRGGPVVMGGHDEREQTLNQLLTEMDGFDPSVGVAVMAATNRPEILDKALLRSGRFDRQIVVDKPGLEDRVSILKLHTRKMKLAADVDLRVVAQRTPGFVGADLANAANEAAIIAVRANKAAIGMADFEAAIDRILAGPEKKSRLLNDAEKHRVAVHESGHALVAEIVPTGQPVHKVSIIPRGAAALGFTLQLPVEEKFLSTEQELKDQIAILLGGRTAEELVFGESSSGAQNDLEKASEIARTMVCSLGMSKVLGPLTYGRRQQLAYLSVEGAEERNFSEETARLIDNEVRKLIEEGLQRVREILTHHRVTLDRLAALLREKEVVSGEDVKAVIREAAS